MSLRSLVAKLSETITKTWQSSKHVRLQCLCHYSSDDPMGGCLYDKKQCDTKMGDLKFAHIVSLI